MLESEIKKLTAALEANTAALTGNKVAAALSEKVATPPKKKAAQASPAAATPTTDPLDDALAITPGVQEVVTDEPAPVVAAATKDEVIAATIALAKAKGRDAPVPIFGTFGIKKATECPEAKYGELVAALTAALA
jgi:hypothetical protein